MPNKKGRPRELEKVIPALKNLPHRPGQVLVGGMRTVDVFIREGKEYFKPKLALWLDQSWGMILNSEVIIPSQSLDGGIIEALAGLIQAIIGPYTLPPAPPPVGSPPFPQPGLPERIVVTDQALAEAVTRLFAPLNVPVEYWAGPIEVLEEAYRGVSQAMGADPEAQPPKPFEWSLETERDLPFLYKAAASFWRRKPWKYITSDFPFRVELGSKNGPDLKTPRLYPVVLGNAGMVIGIAFYFSLADFRTVVRLGEEQADREALIEEGKAMLHRTGRSIDNLPLPMQERVVIEELGHELGLSKLNRKQKQKREKVVESLVVFFDPLEQSDPEYLDWMKKRGFKYPSREAVPSFHRIVPEKGEGVGEGQGRRSLNSREVRAVGLALDAINQFFSRLGFMLERLTAPAKGYFDIEAKAGEQKIVIPVRYPAESYEKQYFEYIQQAIEQEMAEYDQEELEPVEPPSLTALTTLYRFQVKLEWAKRIWRRIEMRGDQTLDDLHEAIQQAFRWDNDHLYAFFLSGKAWDERSAYESPLSEEGRPASRYRLENLPLKAGQQFLYLFDFGDELRHLVKLEAIVPNGVNPTQVQSYPVITELHGEVPPQYGYYDEDEDEDEDEE
jgi:hypothetical protein